MRLMQAEQFIFHSKKCCKFGLRFLPLAVIENALPASISNTLAVSVANRKTDRQNQQITEIKIVNLRLNILTIN